MEAFIFLLVLFGVPLLIVIGLLAAGNAVARPIMRAQHERDVERDMRQAVADANLQQQIARRLLSEYRD